VSLPLRLKAALGLGGLSIRELAVRTWTKINENEILTRASAVSFYAMLAFIPFLALVVTWAVQLLPDLSGTTGQRVGVGNLTVEQLRTTLQSLFPKEAYTVVEDQIARLQRQPPVGLISLGLAITLWTASSLFLAIIDAMNRIYGVEETRPFWKLRLTGMFMTIIQATILIGSLLAIVALPHIVAWLGLSAGAAILAEVVQGLVMVVMVLLSFALTFYVGPDADQRWEWITPGSLVGTFVFLGLSYAFRLYIQGFAHYDKTYGTLSGVMVLLLWFWLSSLVFLIAAQVNKVIEDASPLGKSYGQKKEPTIAPDFAKLPPEPQSK
jgi:membrane protein